jgi:hypothetical protein
MNTTKLAIQLMLFAASFGLIGIGCKSGDNRATAMKPEALLHQDAQAGSDRLRRIHAVRPFLNRIERRAGGGFVAHFGYENRGDTAISVPVGKLNSFLPL